MTDADCNEREALLRIWGHLLPFNAGQTHGKGTSLADAIALRFYRAMMCPCNGLHNREP